MEPAPVSEVGLKANSPTGGHGDTTKIRESSMSPQGWGKKVKAKSHETIRGPRGDKPQ